MSESGFCLVCLESIVAHEPRSIDGARHAHCDKVIDRVTDADRAMKIRKVWPWFRRAA